MSSEMTLPSNCANQPFISGTQPGLASLGRDPHGAQVMFETFGVPGRERLMSGGHGGRFRGGSLGQDAKDGTRRSERRNKKEDQLR